MNGAPNAIVKGSAHHNSSSPTLNLDAKAPPPDSSLLLLTKSPREGVSYWACSKLCAICFVAGVVFGYTLRGRVKRWASALLRKL
ncbi:hypothetical protein HN51_001954 [Arachis hypogaea]|uniref:Transmembrane protein n=2 Tax=Arachis TaxID=3817 RepID=A0A445EPB0_ARAHY|nr:uncharacterized protein LOC107496140 [Arachis duranensis]XP_025604801.1 uncharacterized protein LOC112696296 [Arachis hypogaea]XP_057723880.1 uncharacterized protein LOC130939826 [Arachis stenosperma]QHO50090.1 uncharacterized protein DS421_1g19610 [Arachis hypogaea]RYR77314.1 hypothetical protein Ahy_A01g001751 [Arachis hypogaea]